MVPNGKINAIVNYSKIILLRSLMYVQRTKKTRIMSTQYYRMF